MCNLYSVTKGQAAIIAATRAMRDTTGNLPPLPGIFPDYPAPIVRNAPDGVRELTMARWGMPCPPQFGSAPVTNIRNTKSVHWRRWLGPANRCVVPWTSFCEYADTKPKKTPTWFAFDQDRPLAFFAGLWCSWRGVRGTKANPVEGEHTLFGFLTTEANDVVGAGFSGLCRMAFSTSSREASGKTVQCRSRCEQALPCAEAEPRAILSIRLKKLFPVLGAQPTWPHILVETSQSKMT